MKVNTKLAGAFLSMEALIDFELEKQKKTREDIAQMLEKHENGEGYTPLYIAYQKLDAINASNGRQRQSMCIHFSASDIMSSFLIARGNPRSVRDRRVSTFSWYI